MKARKEKKHEDTQERKAREVRNLAHSYQNSPKLDKVNKSINFTLISIYQSFEVSIEVNKATRNKNRCKKQLF